MRNIFENPHKHYDVPRFTKDKIKETFLKHEGWKVLDEGEGYISFMKDGYVELEGFQVLFITNEEEAKESEPVVLNDEFKYLNSLSSSITEYYLKVSNIIKDLKNNVLELNKHILTSKCTSSAVHYPHPDQEHTGRDGQRVAREVRVAP